MAILAAGVAGGSSSFSFALAAVSSLTLTEELERFNGLARLLMESELLFNGLARLLMDSELLFNGLALLFKDSVLLLPLFTGLAFPLNGLGLELSGLALVGTVAPKETCTGMTGPEEGFGAGSEAAGVATLEATAFGLAFLL